MKLHKARIVGLKQSRKSIRYNYPIFEYIDRNGETKRYIRETGMEITPFSKYKKYTILERGTSTCEKTEDGILPVLQSPSMLAKPLMLLFIIPNTVLLLLFSMIMPIVITQLIKMFKIGRMKHETKSLPPIDGKVVGYVRGNKDVERDVSGTWCRPIVEYPYKDQTYYHTSRKFRRGDDIPEIGSHCTIYLDVRGWHVFDDYEVEAPFYWWYYQQIAIPFNMLKNYMHERIAKSRMNKINQQIQQKHVDKMTEPLAVHLWTRNYSPYKGF